MLTLEPFTPADCDRLIGWVPDARFLLQWAGPAYTFPLTREQLARTWELTQRTPPAHLMFKLCETPGGRVLGHIELMGLNPTERRAHIGRVLIDAAARGRGTGTALMTLLIDHAFGPLGLDTLTLGVFTFNTPALACYQRLGFVPLAEQPPPRTFESETWDILLMQLRKSKAESRTNSD